MKISRKNLIINFLLIWAALTLSIFYGLYLAGFLPDYVKDFGDNFVSYIGSEFGWQATLPLPAFAEDSAQLIIPKIAVTSAIVFPTSTNKTTLNKALRLGAVHYPEAPLPGEDGNIYIFGHSSARAFEKNPAMTVFTNLHKVEVGDEIDIRSAGVTYEYRVTVNKILKPGEVKIYASSTKPMLTLTTCWPIGDPTNRTVVEAEYIGKSLLEANQN